MSSSSEKFSHKVEGYVLEHAIAKLGNKGAITKGVLSSHSFELRRFFVRLASTLRAVTRKLGA